MDHIILLAILTFICLYRTSSQREGVGLETIEKKVQSKVFQRRAIYEASIRIFILFLSIVFLIEPEAHS
jgi:hypothetical protein